MTPLLAIAQASGSKQLRELCLKAHSACFVPEFGAGNASMRDQSDVGMSVWCQKVVFLGPNASGDGSLAEKEYHFGAKVGVKCVFSGKRMP